MTVNEQTVGSMRFESTVGSESIRLLPNTLYSGKCIISLPPIPNIKSTHCKFIYSFDPI